MRKVAVTALVTALLAAGAAAASLPGTCDGVVPRHVSPELVLVSSLDAREELVSLPVGVGSAAVDEHNPAVMFFASLAVPGAGQLVQGNKRGYLYLIAEVALWGGFFALENKGEDERDKYEAYADANWDFEAYSDWYETTCVGCDDCGYECRPLATYGTQEYYEDIGKYATYWRWWNIDGDEGYIEWDAYSDEDVAFRDLYYDMRGDSNTYLRQARYAMMAALLNHIVSAVDSFLTARGGDDIREETLGDMGIEFDVPVGGEGLSCALVARY